MGFFSPPSPPPPPPVPPPPPIAPDPPIKPKDTKEAERVQRRAARKRGLQAARVADQSSLAAAGASTKKTLLGQ